MLRTGGMAACCCCWALYRSMMASSSTAAMLVWPAMSKCFSGYSPQTTAASPSVFPLTTPPGKHALTMIKNVIVLSRGSQRGMPSCLHLLHASPLSGSSWHAADQWKFISLSAYLFLLFATAAAKDAFDEVRLPPPAAKGGLQAGKHSAGSLVSSGTPCAAVPGL